MEQLGSANLTFTPNLTGVLVPQMQRAYEALRVARTELPASLIAPIEALESLLGVRVVRWDALQVMEYMLTRGVVAGGADMSDYLEGEVVDHVFRNTAIFTPPANVYVALFTADPGETGSFANEVADANGYARQAVGTSGGWTGAAGASATDNGADIDFGTASGGAWGTVTHCALCDSAAHATGNIYLYGALAVSKTVGDGDSFKFPTGDLDISFD